MRLYVVYKKGGGFGYIGNSRWMRRRIRAKFAEAMASDEVSEVWKSNFFGKLKQYKPKKSRNNDKAQITH